MPTLESEIVLAEVVEEGFQNPPMPALGLVATPANSSNLKQPQIQNPAPSEWQTAKSRTYFHIHCRQHTVVSDFDHIYVASVFDHPYETFCSTCQKHFPVADFCWSNTNERLTEYYARYQSKFSSSEKLICSGIFPLIAVVVAALGSAVIGFLVPTLLLGRFGIIGALIGGLVGAVCGIKITEKIGNSIRKRVLGTSDYTQLR